MFCIYFIEQNGDVAPKSATNISSVFEYSVRINRGRGLQSHSIAFLKLNRCTNEKRSNLETYLLT